MNTLCRSALRSIALVAFALLAGACATTSSDVQKWGERGNFTRVIQELRTGQPSDEIRIAAAAALGRANDPTALDELIKLSTDPSPRVRHAAVSALGQQKGPKVFTAVIRRMSDDDAETARTAKSVLAHWGDSSIDYVIEALESGDFRVRVNAVQLLAKMKDARVNKELCRRAKLDESAIARQEAARAIGQRAAGECRDVLYRMKTGDPSAEVRMEAEAALAKVGDNVSKAQIVVLPPATLPEGLNDSFRKKLTLELTRRMVDGKLCEVLPTPVKLIDNPAENASTLAEMTGASQIVYFTAARSGNRITVQVFRMDETGATLQQEQQTDLDSKIDQLVTKVADLFVQKFGNR